MRGGPENRLLGIFIMAVVAFSAMTFVQRESVLAVAGGLSAQRSTAAFMRGAMGEGLVVSAIQFATFIGILLLLPSVTRETVTLRYGTRLAAWRAAVLELFGTIAFPLLAGLLLASALQGAPYLSLADADGGRWMPLLASAATWVCLLFAEVAGIAALAMSPWAPRALSWFAAAALLAVMFGTPALSAWSHLPPLYRVVFVATDEDPWFLLVCAINFAAVVVAVCSVALFATDNRARLHAAAGGGTQS